MIKGVLDRIEDNIAVILAEDIGKQFTIPKEKLPSKSKEGTWFSLKVTGEECEILGIDENLTKEKEADSADLLAQLRAKKGSKYKRS